MTSNQRKGTDPTGRVSEFNPVRNSGAPSQEPAPIPFYPPPHTIPKSSTGLHSSENSQFSHPRLDTTLHSLQPRIRPRGLPSGFTDSPPPAHRKQRLDTPLPRDRQLPRLGMTPHTPLPKQTHWHCHTHSKLHAETSLLRNPRLPPLFSPPHMRKQHPPANPRPRTPSTPQQPLGSHAHYGGLHSPTPLYSPVVSPNHFTPKTPIPPPSLQHISQIRERTSHGYTETRPQRKPFATALYSPPQVPTPLRPHSGQRQSGPNMCITPMKAPAMALKTQPHQSYSKRDLETPSPTSSTHSLWDLDTPSPTRQMKPTTPPQPPCWPPPPARTTLTRHRLPSGYTDSPERKKPNTRREKPLPVAHSILTPPYCQDTPPNSYIVRRRGIRNGSGVFGAAAANQLGRTILCIRENGTFFQ